MDATANRGAVILAAIVLTAGASGGCVVHGLSTADRMKCGLVIVLPGIEGRSKYNVGIARGLYDGGVPCAIEIYDWGTGNPLVNLVALERNRGQARRIADRVLEYQRDYVGRPVHLVGHSGGGGLAVLALEALPPGARVTSAVLLAAAVSPDHDLTRALNHTEVGIWNFYSRSDIGYLRLGTGVFGTIDRKRTSAAGAVGFKQPDPRTRKAATRAYEKLHSVAYKETMGSSGHGGGHTGWTDQQFVAEWLAPVILAASDGRAGYTIPLDDRLSAKTARARAATSSTSRPTGPTSHAVPRPSLTGQPNGQSSSSPRAAASGS